MAQINIYGDIDSGSMFFLNSTVDPKALGTIEATLKSDEDRIVVKRTDRFEADGVTFRTLFKRLNPRRVNNRGGEELVDQLGYTTQQVIDYINEQNSLTGSTGGDGNGVDVNAETICFTLDDTSTSIIMDNGFSFGVNTIKAVELDGCIQIESIQGGRPLFTKLLHSNVCIDGVLVSGGLNDVINTLNELFTVGPFQSVVITDPEATVIADVAGVVDGGDAVGSNAVDPLGDDVLGTIATHNNAAGYLSANTINQAGEYFTFDIAGKATYGFGLVHTQASFDNGKFLGNSSYADPAGFCVGANSSHLGYQFSHHFHVGNAHASWTNYGANTGYVLGEAWYDHNNSFDLKDEWNAGDPVKVQVGINELGFITISTLHEDGVNWRLHARSSYPVPEGSEFKLGVKLQTTGARLRTEPKVHLRVEEAPTMHYRFIESPDNNFYYPLFATEAEANYYDTEAGGSGTSHTHVFVDDPTNTVWYMPTTNAVHDGTSAPVADLTTGAPGLYTEITSLTNAALVPPAFSDTTITVDELSLVNYQVSPMDVDYATTIGGIPAFSMSGNAVVGTAPEVAGDNVANPSDTTTVTVYRTNSYGTSQGTLTINITNLTAPTVTPIAGVSHEGGTALIDSDTMDDGSVISIDNVIDNGNRFVIGKEFLDNVVLPKITSGSGSKSVWVGFAPQGTSANWTDISNVDFRIAYEFNCDDSSRANNNFRLKTHVQGSSFANVGVGSLTNGLYDFVLINDGATLKSGALVASAGHDASTKLFNPNDGDWQWTLSNTSSVGNQDIVIATVGTDMDIDLQYFSEHTEPTAPASLTSWSKAVDFSGSSERAMQVGTNSNYMPIAMDGLSATVSAPTTSGNTSGHIYSRPWATAIVFKADGNNSNQHIWNLGEGVGSNNDNIYVRLSSNGGGLYFGWGRDGALNECYIGSIFNQIQNNEWVGLYVAHNGTRYNSSSATPANLMSAFDIRLFDETWTVGSNKSNQWGSNLSSTGARMDRSVVGSLTIGGRGANRTFHGKVASFVTTTLRVDQPMPTSAEIELMVTDPVKWLQDYKDGNAYRLASSQAEATFGLLSYLTNSAFATQVWLMGDGSLDNYSNMIRNQVFPSDQNYTKLNLISMVSNDIQTVNIPGLS
tara:strand:+ start:1032 stop:4421 length:3390 start_codon:yes stop_codon:yes gene_type:complete